MPIAIGFFVGHAYAILFVWVLVEQVGEELRVSGESPATLPGR